MHIIGIARLPCHVSVLARPPKNQRGISFSACRIDELVQSSYGIQKYWSRMRLMMASL